MCSRGHCSAGGRRASTTLWGPQLPRTQPVSNRLSSNKTEIQIKQTLRHMKSQSACHCCIWKEYCFPSKTAVVQDCFGSSWNTKPLSIALSILLACLIQMCNNHHSCCQNQTPPPPIHTYVCAYSKSSLLHEVFAPERETWEKCVKILATNTSKKKLYAWAEGSHVSPCWFKSYECNIAYTTRATSWDY